VFSTRASFEEEPRVLYELSLYSDSASAIELDGKDGCPLLSAPFIPAGGKLGIPAFDFSPVGFEGGGKTGFPDVLRPGIEGAKP